MVVLELANRYAKALFEIASDNGSKEKVFSDLRALDSIFLNEPDVVKFLGSARLSSRDRLSVLDTAFKGKGVCEEVRHLLALLAERGRIGLFHDIVEAYQEASDTENKVCRGTVHSAVALDPSERQKIEDIVEKVLTKKVIMTYKVDPSLIGGLVARVGSYTFDDSIASHLTRMSEDLKRRTV